MLLVSKWRPLAGWSPPPANVLTNVGSPYISTALQYVSYFVQPYVVYTLCRCEIIKLYISVDDVSTTSLRLRGF